MVMMMMMMMMIIAKCKDGTDNDDDDDERIIAEGIDPAFYPGIDGLIVLRRSSHNGDDEDDDVADFPAVFFHICHGTQQAVVTPYRAYQNV